MESDMAEKGIVSQTELQDFHWLVKIFNDICVMESNLSSPVRSMYEKPSI